MALVTKNDVTQIFAIQAPEVDLPPTFANYPRGWDTARSNNGKPTIKQFNYIQQRTDQNVLWIHQNGAALPYDATMEYAEGAVVVKDGELQKKQGASWVPVSNKGYNLDYFVSGKPYPLHAEIMLANGDTVKSTAPNNTTNPNIDMTGWVIPYLVESSNLSDVPDKVVARTNLGVYSTTQVITAISKSATPAATELVAGKAKIATTSIAQAGVNDTDFITPLKLRGALNAAGTAPVYACRAWVNFNGTGTPSIRGSGNVSSITDNGVGSYTVNLSVPMQDLNYCVTGSSAVNNNPTDANNNTGSTGINNLSLNSFRVVTGYPGDSGDAGAAVDAEFVQLAVFR